MNVRVVSRNTVFRDVLVSVCGGRGLVISGTYDSYSGLTLVNAGDVLLLHAFEEFKELPTRLAELTRTYPGIRIMVLAPAREAAELRHQLGDLVTAIIPETESADTLISALILAQQGYRMTPEPLEPLKPPRQHANGVQRTDHVPTAQIEPVATKPVHHLSKREVAIMAHLCAGASNKEIANRLGISDATVKVHLRTAFRKIGVTNRTQAAMWAMEHL